MLRLLALVAVLYLAGGAALWFVQRGILFRPDPTRPDAAAVGVPGLRAVTLHTASGLDLLAWWLPPAEGRPVLLYFHGNGGSIAFRAARIRAFAAAGLGVLMPEYPGYGGNPGAPTETSLFATATAAVGFLASAGIAPDRTVPYGESLGTAVATFLAAGGTRFRALILESPFTSVVALAAERYWFLPVRWLVRDPFDTLDRIGAIRSPLLVAFGEHDDVVPPPMGRAVFAAAPDPKRLWVAPEGSHSDLAAYGLLPVVERFASAPP